MSRVVIVGGGISGLSAAYALHKLRPELEVQLFEASDRLGGNIYTDHVDGFVIEHGPDSFVVGKPHALQLCRELGVEDQLISTPEEHRLVHFVRGGQLVPLPEGLVLGVPTRLLPLLGSSLLSWAGKLRAALEPLMAVRPGDDDESVHDFFARRLGSEIAERIAGPLIGGIYAGDPRQLSLLATFPQFRQLELQYGSLVLGMLATRGKTRPAPPTRPASALGRLLQVLRRALGPRTPAGPAFLSFPAGMKTLIEVLAAALPAGCIRLSSAVAHVSAANPQGGTPARVTLSSGQTLDADAVLLATPVHQSAQLLADEALQHELSTIQNVSTATVVLAFDRGDVAHSLNGVGFVVPEGEGRILAATWISSKWQHRTPTGKVLMRAFLGGPAHDEQAGLPDAELIELALSELRRLMGHLGQPLLARVYRYQRASPQPLLGHPQRMQRIHARLQQYPGLFLSAGGLDGIGIPDSVKYARAAAERIAKAVS